jgi:glucose/arabinose dehydrogenase
MISPSIFSETNIRLQCVLNSCRRKARMVSLAILAMFALLALPACKHKQSQPSNENSAGVPATPPAPAQSNPAPADNNAAQPQAPAQPEPAATPQPIIVAAGTPFAIRITEELGSKASQTGQTFAATLDKDVIVDGQTAIASGANVVGTVVSAKPYGRFAGEASLVLRLTSVNINNSDQSIVTAARSFGPKIKAKGAVKKFFGGLAKRAEGDEREVVLAAQSAYTFTLKQPLQIQ